MAHSLGSKEDYSHGHKKMHTTSVITNLFLIKIRIFPRSNQELSCQVVVSKMALGYRCVCDSFIQMVGKKGLTFLVVFSGQLHKLISRKRIV